MRQEPDRWAGSGSTMRTDAGSGGGGCADTVETWLTLMRGGLDGIRVDSLGRLWTAAADGVHCVHPDGALLGKLAVPSAVSNLTFGGPRHNVLFLTATSAVFSIMVNVTGARYPA